jgi:hypothetical protein
LQVTSEAEVFDGSHQTLQVPKLQVTQWNKTVSVKHTFVYLLII